ncbi:MAG: succinate dehydrogenase flavoprotein subunit [Gammaproteobacteria bacterium]
MTTIPKNAGNLDSIQMDALIVGGGGAGMRAALQLSQSGLKTAVISKVFPTRSHTVSAQGGITCSIQSADPNDDWRWHMFDTVKGSDYISDQDAVEYMCSEGPKAVFELEHMGMPFSRTESGRIYQRPFGGQSKDYGKGGQAARTCAAADRTGHALLHTLYQGNLKAQTHFFHEWFAVDLVLNAQGSAAGVIALCIETGEFKLIKARSIVLATGGGGRIYESTTNALINTGDGLGMVARAGLPLQDMEMWQFHPTGIYGAGPLISEGSRGEGGYLINSEGERFMERYAPNARDLASRDVVARSIELEILAGRGCGPLKDHVYLRLDHLGKAVLDERLPGICELSRTFAQADPIYDPIPVVPTCHYMMGGIPTNIHGQVLRTEKDDADSPDQIVPGLYACGEAACVSVHGANRLGGNSLLDLIVFGRAVGLHIEQNTSASQSDIQDSDLQRPLQLIDHLHNHKGSESVASVRADLQKTMQGHFGVFRDLAHMEKGLAQLQQVRARLADIRLEDSSSIFNTARIEALELLNLMAVAEATAYSAIARNESRGAHSRKDFPKRNDQDWLCHSLFYASSQKVHKRAVNQSPKQVDAFPPIERTY